MASFGIGVHPPLISVCVLLTEITGGGPMPRFSGHGASTARPRNDITVGLLPNADWEHTVRAR